MVSRCVTCELGGKANDTDSDPSVSSRPVCETGPSELLDRHAGVLYIIGLPFQRRLDELEWIPHSQLSY